MPGQMKDPRNTQGKICPVCRARGEAGIGCAWALQYTGDLNQLWKDVEPEHDAFQTNSPGEGEAGEVPVSLAQEALSAEGLAQMEEEAGHQLSVWVQCFLDFPCERNRQGVMERMIEYQSSWMNGRRRCP